MHLTIFDEGNRKGRTRPASPAWQTATNRAAAFADLSATLISLRIRNYALHYYSCYSAADMPTTTSILVKQQKAVSK